MQIKTQNENVTPRVDDEVKVVRCLCLSCVERNPVSHRSVFCIRRHVGETAKVLELVTSNGIPVSVRIYIKDSMKVLLNEVSVVQENLEVTPSDVTPASKYLNLLNL